MESMIQTINARGGREKEAVEKGATLTKLTRETARHASTMRISRKIIPHIHHIYSYLQY